MKETEREMNEGGRFQFLGISFWNRTTEELLANADRRGGLFTVPSAPSLAQMLDDPLLKASYQGSDWAVVDGGYVALILRFVLGKSVRRISGLQILQKLLSPVGGSAVPMGERAILWVVPNQKEEEAIAEYLVQGGDGGFKAERQRYYQAPLYRGDEDYSDTNLFEAVREFKPDWVVLCIGGGRQEKLGWYLRRQFPQLGERKPVILCTGGAIMFLTGTQANIPTWADRLYLGWFLRILQNPKLFFPRYYNAAWKFPKLLWKSRGNLFGEKRK